MIPPMSVTVARIFPKIGAQLGAVSGATRISPSRTWSICAGLDTTRAGPSAIPGEAAIPVSTPGSSPPPTDSHWAMLSSVMPQSMMVNGSVTRSGGTPSAGGGGCCARARRMSLRCRTSAGHRVGPREGAATAHEL